MGRRGQRSRRRARGGAGGIALVLAAVLTPAAVSLAEAQPESPRRPGLLKGIRDRLIPPNAAEAWAVARSLPSAAEALPLMENLARRDGPESVRAALWLGHFFYGAGDLPLAREWFERALEGAGEGSERSEARAWAEQCRGLAGAEAPSPPAAAAPRSLREALALADGALAAGETARARAAYLGLEEEARRAGMLAPLLYRLARISGGEDGSGARGPTGAEEAKMASCGPSPERALLRALRPGLAPSSPAARATGTPPFALPETPESPDSAISDAPAPAAAGPAAPAAAGAPLWSVQLGSFVDRARAEAEAERLRGLGLPVRLEGPGANGGPYRIRWGSFRSREEAEESARARCTGLAWTLVAGEPPSP